MASRSKAFYDNLVRVVDSYQKGEIRVSHYPVAGYIEPATVGNLKCPSCPTGINAPVRDRSLLPYERFCTLLDEWGEYLYQLYMYNWGEPLLNKDIARMVEYAAVQGIEVHASSNLSVNMTLDDARRIVKSGLGTLKVGIDGLSQEVYEKYRRKGKLDKVLANVKMIAQAKKEFGMKTPILVVSYHVFEHNEHELPFMKNFLLECGIDIVNFASAFLPVSEDYGVRGPKKYKQFDVREQYEKKIPADAATRKCSWLWFAMVHNPNGTVSPCCGITHEEDDFGKVSEGIGVLDVFNSPRYLASRALQKRDPSVSYNTSMGVSIDREYAHTICERCPVPYIVNNFKPEKLLSAVKDSYGIPIKSTAA